MTGCRRRDQPGRERPPRLRELQLRGPDGRPARVRPAQHPGQRGDQVLARGAAEEHRRASRQVREVVGHLIGPIKINLIGT